MSPDRVGDLWAAPETQVWLEANGSRCATWLCTPDRLEDLAAGWLLAEGYVSARDELLGVDADPAAGVVRARVGDGVIAALRARARVIGPLVPPHATTMPSSSRRLSRGVADLLMDRERLAGLYEEMFARSRLREAAGGVHTGGLVESALLVDVVEDVGRGNVFDKLVGAAFLRERSLQDSLVLLSGRVSGVIALKACRAGVAAVASISIPTSLACELAARCGVTLVGRARRAAPHIHWPPDE